MIANDRFLEFAKRIVSAKGKIPEEECRSAVSRAYYSLFHETGSTLRRRYSLGLVKQLKRQLTRRKRKYIDYRRLSRLDTRYIQKMGLNMHKACRDTLFEVGHERESKLFHAFRIKRNQADYDLDLNFRKDDSRATVAAIESLMNQIEGL